MLARAHSNISNFRLEHAEKQRLILFFLQIFLNYWNVWRAKKFSRAPTWCWKKLGGNFLLLQQYTAASHNFTCQEIFVFCCRNSKCYQKILQHHRKQFWFDNFSQKLFLMWEFFFYVPLKTTYFWTPPHEFSKINIFYENQQSKLFYFGLRKISELFCVIFG